jgi:hypothetical protein
VWQKPLPLLKPLPSPLLLLLPPRLLYLNLLLKEANLEY